MTPSVLRRPRVRTVLLAVLLLSGLLAASAPAASAQVPWSPPIGPTHFVTVSDGVEIAINVRMPLKYREGQRVPTIFEIGGYENGSTNDKTFLGYTADEFGIPGVPLQEGSRQLTKWFYENYATVHASVRGTGCSGGEFDLFSWRSALDGREVIEWIARQPWSNGRVGLMGHSYSGITAFMVAATRPPHLTAITTSGLIDDIYRGIVYPGGVTNYGFPLLWATATRAGYDYLGAQGQPIVTGANRERCLANIATHRRTVTNEPLVHGTQDTDSGWFRSKSLIEYVHRVAVPIHITGAYQDEQTGPRGPANLWENVRGVPKRLLLTNGDHGTNQARWVMENERVPWMDHWMRGVDRGHGTLRQDRTSVRVLFETHHGDEGEVPGGILNARRFPIETTRWIDYYLHPEGALSTAKPTAAGSASYANGTKRQSWSYQAGPTSGSDFTTPEGPDELNFRSEPLTRPVAIAGPITATLHMSATGTDTEFMVFLIDEGPDGSRTYLQRGLLRASHRAIDPGMSDWTRDPRTKRKHMYRPYRPHTSTVPIVPSEVYEYVVEVFPVGHVFRPGHRIALKIHAPSVIDSYYAYMAKTPPTVNTVQLGGEAASRLTLPVVPLNGVRLGPELGCGEQSAVRCVSD